MNKSLVVDSLVLFFILADHSERIENMLLIEHNSLSFIIRVSFHKEEKGQSTLMIALSRVRRGEKDG